jgi:hypothetical protein
MKDKENLKISPKLELIKETQQLNAGWDYEFDLNRQKEHSGKLVKFILDMYLT